MIVHDWWKKRFFTAVKDDKITYKNIKKTTTDHGDDYTAGCLLD